MPRITTRVIDIGLALALTDLAKQANAAWKRPPFLCPECQQPLRPIRESSTGTPAHFQHWDKSPSCPLSTP